VRATGAGLVGAGGVGTAAGGGDNGLQTVQDEPWADVDYEGEQLDVPTKQGVTISGTADISLFVEEMDIDIYVDSVDGQEPSFSRVAEGVVVDPPDPNAEFSPWETTFDFSGVPNWRDLEVTIELTETGEEITEDGPVPGRTTPGAVEFDIDRPVPVPEYETTFDASATGGAVESYQWEFDDGETATGEVVTHAYSEAGSYQVELTVERPDTENVQTTTSEYDVPAMWAEVDYKWGGPRRAGAAKCASLGHYEPRHRRGHGYRDALRNRSGHPGFQNCRGDVRAGDNGRRAERVDRSGGLSGNPGWGRYRAGNGVHYRHHPARGSAICREFFRGGDGSRRARDG
jgi:PKD domain.